MAAMEEHLCELEEQKARIDALIRLVRRSVISMRGENKMSDAENLIGGGYDFEDSIVGYKPCIAGTEDRQRGGFEL